MAANLKSLYRMSLTQENITIQTTKLTCDVFALKKTGFPASVWTRRKQTNIISYLRAFRFTQQNHLHKDISSLLTLRKTK